MERPEQRNPVGEVLSVSNQRAEEVGQKGVEQLERDTQDVSHFIPSEVWELMKDKRMEIERKAYLQRRYSGLENDSKSTAPGLTAVISFGADIDRKNQLIETIEAHNQLMLNGSSVKEISKDVLKIRLPRGAFRGGEDSLFASVYFDVPEWGVSERGIDFNQMENSSVPRFSTFYAMTLVMFGDDGMLQVQKDPELRSYLKSQISPEEWIKLPPIRTTEAAE